MSYYPVLKIKLFLIGNLVKLVCYYVLRNTV